MFMRSTAVSLPVAGLFLALAIVPGCDGCEGGPVVDEPLPEIGDDCDAVDECGGLVCNVDLGRCAEQGDLDSDGVPNQLDEDIDGDGATNLQESGPDGDSDGDGIENSADDTPLGDNNVDPEGDNEAPDCVGAQGDCDNDGLTNGLDNDDDNDGVPDGVVGPGTCDGVTPVNDESADCDGYCISLEGGFINCNDGNGDGIGNPDTDGDGIPDPLDPDDDGDGIPDGDDDFGGGLEPEDPVVTPPGGEGEGEGEGNCSVTSFNAGDDLLDPRILLVIDKSGSMNADDTGGQRKWDSARNALSGVVTTLDDSIEFGLMLYPDGDGNNNVCREGALREPVEVSNGNDIVDVLNNTEPGGGTPTATTLNEARGVLDALGADGGARAVVLATDGGPNCNESLDGNSCRCVSANPQDCVDFPGNCLDDTNAIAAVAGLNAAGYPVFTLGIDGAEAFNDVLNAFATAGGTAQAGATAFYTVDDEAQFQQALEDIAVRVGVCRFDLPTNFQADQATVTVNGQTVARDTARLNGWDQVDPNTIELFGVPCDQVVDGGGGIAIVEIQVCVG